MSATIHRERGRPCKEHSLEMEVLCTLPSHQNVATIGMLARDFKTDVREMRELIAGLELSGRVVVAWGSVWVAPSAWNAV